MCGEWIDELLDSFKPEWINKHSTVESKLLSVAEDDINEYYNGSNISEINREAKFEIPYHILLQIEEVVDISLPFEQRIMLEFDQYNGTFKLLLSDGHNLFCGLISADESPLTPQSKPGAKILIKKGTIVRFGVIFLNTESFIFIGGSSPISFEKERKTMIFDKNARPVYQKPELIKAPKKTKAAQKPKPKPKPKQKAEKPTNEQKKQKKVFLSSDSLTDPVDDVDGAPVEPPQSLQRTQMNSETFKPRSIQKCTVSEVTGMKVVRREGRLIFRVSVLIGDGRAAEVSPALAERLIGQSPDTFLSLPSDAQRALSESAMMTLIKNSFELTESESGIMLN